MFLPALNRRRVEQRPLLKAAASTAALSLALLGAGQAKAILVFEFLEVGSDVRVQMSGSLSNITPESTPCGAFPSAARIIDTDARIVMNGGFPAMCTYTITGPTSWGSVGRIDGDSSTFTGDVARLWGAESEISIFDGYIPGNPLSASFLIRSNNLAGLGFTEGLIASYNVVGGDTISVYAGPAPSAQVPGPLPLLGAAAAFARSRRIRSRLKGTSNRP